MADAEYFLAGSRIAALLCCSRLSILEESTGFMGLGGGDMCLCEGCQWQGRMVRIRELWPLAGLGFCQGHWFWQIGAHFAVSGKRIKQQPR